MRKIQFVLRCLPRAALLLSLYAIILFRWGGNPAIWEYDGWNAFAVTFSILPSPDAPEITGLLFSLTPCVLLLYLFCNEFREDFTISYVYVFTRYQKKGRWFFRRAGQLLLLTAFLFLLLFLAIALLIGLLGYELSFSEQTVQMVLLLYVTQVAGFYFFLLLENLLSLPLGTTRAFLAAAFFFLLFAVLAIASCSNRWDALLYLNPVAQMLYFLHDKITVPQLFAAGCLHIPGFSVSYSLVFLLVLLLILCAVFLRALYKKDFMQMMGGEQE